MFMNKLLLKPQIYIEKEDSYELVVGEDAVEIVLAPYTSCKLLALASSKSQNVTIHLSKESRFEYQSFLQNINSKIQIFLEGEGASVDFVYSMLASSKCGLKVEVYHQSSHTSSRIHNAIVNYGEELASLSVDASVPKGCVSCHLTQDNRITLLKNGKGKILPNLWIDEFDCFAEHSAYISKFSKEKMFYCRMRGIQEQDVYFLLTKSMLLGNMNVDDEHLTQFTEMIQKMGR